MRALAVAVFASLLLTSCSGDDGTSGSAPSPPAPTTAATPESPEPPGSPGSDSSEPGPPATYVALGDSYTAAPGVPVTETGSGCQRSSSNYPSIVAEHLDLVLDDVSCIGADTLALVGAQVTDQGPVPPQFLALDEGLELVTLSMGGNDEGLFRDLAQTCLAARGTDPDGSPCQESMAAPGGGDRARDRIAMIGTRLTSALTGIQDAAPRAQVVLIGYPQLVPEKGQCPGLPLATGDYAYLRSIIADLGAATEKAARDAGATYVDLLAPSEGHDVCAGADAWVNGIANDTGRSAAPLHPFAEEQQAVAALVEKAVGTAAG